MVIFVVPSTSIATVQIMSSTSSAIVSQLP